MDSRRLLADFESVMKQPYIGEGLTDRRFSWSSNAILCRLQVFTFVCSDIDDKIQILQRHVDTHSSLKCDGVMGNQRGSGEGDTDGDAGGTLNAIADADAELY